MKDFINIRGHGNVRFHAREPATVQLAVFALGYRQAARSLASRFSSKGVADYEAYPILYLYRHALELYLKALVFRGASLMGLLGRSRPDTRELFRKHEFGRLVAPLRAIFSAMGLNLESAGFESFADFERFLRKLDELDPASYTFRFPLDRDGNIATPDWTLNVTAFAQTLDPLLDYLEGAVDMIDEHWQSTAELQHEMREFLGTDDGS